MRQFSNIGEFVEFLEVVRMDIPLAEHRGLESAGHIIETEAKHEIGAYQDGAGPFAEWQKLSDATLGGFWIQPHGPYVQGKEELGYAPPDNPLLRTGELRESVKHTVQANEVVVGSDLDVAVWQELGTPDAKYPIPPRSFLGGAAFRKAYQAVNALTHSVVYTLAGLPAFNRPPD